MRTPLPALAGLAAALVLAAVVPPPPLHASDHADPILLSESGPGITGLFFFPDGEDRLILVLATNPGLKTDPPYDLEPYEYTVHMDLTTPVSFDSAEDRARYGGTVVEPSAIRADATLSVRLNDDASLRRMSIEGLGNQEEIELWTGVRDDPFIFPNFFGTNVVAAVFSIPRSSFPEGQQDWILWGTTSEGGDQIDHVGRSNRTQNGRFDFLNTIPPSEQLAAIRDKAETRHGFEEYLTKVVAPLAPAFHLLFQIRNYDFAPDVMIYTDRYPPGYPNGRRLTDDVAALSCQQGDCVLMELSYADGKQWPRRTTNDKAFLDEVPYLAEPWPTQPAEPSGINWAKILTVVALVILIFLPGALLCWLFGRLRSWKGKKA